jgi:hypothetical protein
MARAVRRVGARLRVPYRMPLQRAAAATALALGLLFGAGLWWSGVTATSAPSPWPESVHGPATASPPTVVQAATDSTPMVFDPPAAGVPAAAPHVSLEPLRPAAAPADPALDARPDTAPSTEPSPRKPQEARPAEVVPPEAPAPRAGPTQARSPPTSALAPVAGTSPQHKVAALAAPRNPRQVCGDHAGFALYQCMQLQCAKSGWATHEQCTQLRRSDAVD